MPGVYDRFTVNWSTAKELEEAKQIRQRAAAQGRSLNGIIKRLLREWLAQQSGTSKESGV